MAEQQGPPLAAAVAGAVAQDEAQGAGNQSSKRGIPPSLFCRIGVCLSLLLLSEALESDMLHTVILNLLCFEGFHDPFSRLFVDVALEGMTSGSLRSVKGPKLFQTCLEGK